MTLSCCCCGLNETEVTLPKGALRIDAVAEFVLVSPWVFCRRCLVRIAKNDPAEHNEHVKRWAAKYYEKGAA